MARAWDGGSVLAAIALAGAIACGGSEPSTGSGYALEVRLGTHDDGSGRKSLAFLATLRDATGSGPDGPWNLVVRDDTGAETARIPYEAPGIGSFVAGWRSDVAAQPGKYSILATSGQGDTVSTEASPPESSLALPQPSLSTQGSQVVWPPIPGAAAYVCRAFSGGELQLETSGSEPSCDLSALPAGGYAVSVLALSVDLAVLGANTEQHPSLGDRFDVSEAALGVVAGTSSSAQIRVAGGAYDEGIGERAIAIWLSISNPDGSATGERWNVDVVGPNLPASSPLEVSYPPNFPRLMAWAPMVPATPGTYDVTATSESGGIAFARFTLGSPEWIGFPLNVTATGVGQGAAHASWSAAQGARSYLASAYDATTGAFVSSVWVAEARADFPQGTFTPGNSYEVYVAATDADMVFGEVPTQVGVAENIFDYGSFVAP